MDPRHMFIDERLTGGCVYCGRQPDTRDHVPPKVMLDEPFPPNLPVVYACRECNEKLSLDEEYTACFLECVICGDSNPAHVQRPNIQRILRSKRRLKSRIAKSRLVDDAGNILWHPDTKRFRRLVEKLAQGHLAYEIHRVFSVPDNVAFAPLDGMSDNERAAFEDTRSAASSLLPEIGTRAFLRAAGRKPDRFEQADGWIVIQPGRYRYAIIESGGVSVRMVLAEYLACVAVWQ